MGALDIAPTYTYRDYRTWEGSWELIGGVAYAMSPAPYPKHQRVVKRIAWELEKSLNCEGCELYLSPVDWKIDETTVVQPDLAIFCEKPQKQYFSETPPLIVEVLSKATAQKDVTVKYDLYENTGVRYYVIVEPENETAEVFMLDNGAYRRLYKISTPRTIELEWDECRASIDFKQVF